VSSQSRLDAQTERGTYALEPATIDELADLQANRVEGTPIATAGTALAKPRIIWFAGRTPNEAGATGLEPATSAVTGQRSNQLSYAPAMTLQANGA
jgi:hypothetical protein